MMVKGRTIGTPFGRAFRWVAVVLVLAPLLFVAWERHGIESVQNTVAIVLDGHEITPDLYPQMKTAGATGVALYEWTVQDALDSGDVFLISYDALWTAGSSLVHHLPPLSAGELYLGWRSGDEATHDGASHDSRSHDGASHDSGSHDGASRDSRSHDGASRDSASTHRETGPWRSRIAERLHTSSSSDVVPVDAPHGYDVWRVAGEAVLSLLRMPLGFDPGEIHAASAAGLVVIPRILVGDGPFEGRIAERLATVDTEGPILFRGTRVVDSDFGIELLEIAATSNTPVGIIEFSPQTGLQQVIRANGYRALRVHSITDREMASPHMTETRATERLMRAVRERNMRLLYVRLFPAERFDTELETEAIKQNVQYVGNLAQRLEASGYTIGLPQPMSFLPTSRLNLMGVGVAVSIVGALAGLLAGLLGGLVRRKFPLAIGVVIGAIGLSLVFWFVWLKGYTVIARQMVAFAAAVIFPVVAVLAAVHDRGMIRSSPEDDAPTSLRAHLWWSATRSFLVATAITLVGVLVLIGLLDDPRFMLKIEEFRGVKAAHVLPPLIVAAWFFAVFVAGPWMSQHVVRQFFATRVSVFQLIIAGVACAVIGFYVLRTGNEGAPVPWVEMAIRRYLEEHLWVRPRTKEFLIGHPALFLALAFGPLLAFRRIPDRSRLGALQRPILFGLLIAGTIGQLSILNTFAHIHVPLMVSVIRTLLGLGLGLALGLAATVVVSTLGSRIGRNRVDINVGR